MKLTERTKDCLRIVAAVVLVGVVFCSVCLIYQKSNEKPKYTPVHIKTHEERMNEIEESGRIMNELAFRTEYLRPGGLRDTYGPIPSLEEKIMNCEL